MFLIQTCSTNIIGHIFYSKIFSLSATIQCCSLDLIMTDWEIWVQTSYTRSKLNESDNEIWKALGGWKRQGWGCCVCNEKGKQKNGDLLNSLLTQTVCDDSIEELDKGEAEVEQQEQEEITRIFVGEDQPLPVVQFALDPVAETAFVLVGEGQHINDCGTVQGEAGARERGFNGLSRFGRDG